MPTHDASIEPQRNATASFAFAGPLAPKWAASMGPLALPSARRPGGRSTRWSTAALAALTLHFHACAALAPGELVLPGSPACAPWGNGAPSTDLAPWPCGATALASSCAPAPSSAQCEGGDLAWGTLRLASSAAEATLWAAAEHGDATNSSSTAGRWLVRRADGGAAVLRFPAAGGAAAAAAAGAFAGGDPALAVAPSAWGAVIAPVGGPLAVAPPPGSLPRIAASSPAGPVALIRADSGVGAATQLVVRMAVPPSDPPGAVAWLVDGQDATRGSWTEVPLAHALAVDISLCSSSQGDRAVNVTLAVSSALGSAARTLLVAAVAPPALRAPSPPWVVAAVGTPAQLLVEVLHPFASSLPPVVFTWTHRSDGGVGGNSSSPAHFGTSAAATVATTTTAAPSLFIPAVSPADSGAYTVTACSEGLGCSSPVTLALVVVLAPPTIEQPPPTAVIATTGDAVTVSALVSGGGVVRVAWVRGDGTVLATGALPLPHMTWGGGLPATTIGTTPAASVSLVWPAATSRDATPNITLVVSNAAGSVAAPPFSLEVGAPPWELNCAPAVVFSVLAPATSAADDRSAHTHAVVGAAPRWGAPAVAAVCAGGAARSASSDAVAAGAAGVGASMLLVAGGDPRPVGPPPECTPLFNLTHRLAWVDAAPASTGGTPAGGAGGGGISPPPLDNSTAAVASALEACGWDAGVLAPSSSGFPAPSAPILTGGGPSHARLLFAPAPSPPPGVVLPQCTVTVELTAALVPWDWSPAVGAPQRCDVRVALPRVPAAARVAATPPPSPSPSSSVSPSPSGSATPSLGWMLLASPSPYPSSITASPTLAPRWEDVGPRADALLEGEAAALRDWAAAVGAAAGVVAACAAMAAHRRVSRRRALSRPHATHSPAAPTRRWERVHAIAVVALVAAEDALAPFATSVWAWDCWAWAQFVGLTGALALAQHPAYSGFVAGCAPALLLPPPPRNALSGALAAAHAAVGEPPQADAAWAALPLLHHVLNASGGNVEAPGALSDVEAAALRLSAGRGGGLHRMGRHVDLPAGDWALVAAAAAAVAVAVVAVLAPLAAGCAYAAAGRVAARFPSAYARSLSWGGVASVAGGWVLAAECASAPGLGLSAMAAWQRGVTGGASALGSAVGAVAVAAVCSAWAARAVVARGGAPQRAGCGAPAGYAAASPALAAGAIVWMAVVLPLAVVTGSPAGAASGGGVGPPALGQAATLAALALAGAATAVWFSPPPPAQSQLQAQLASAGDQAAASRARTASSNRARARVLACTLVLQAAVLLALLGGAASASVVPAGAPSAATAALRSVRAAAAWGVGLCTAAGVAGVLLAAHGALVRRLDAVAASARKRGCGLTAAALQRLASTTLERRTLPVPCWVPPEELGLDRCLLGGRWWGDAPGAVARWGMAAGVVWVALTRQVVPYLVRPPQARAAGVLPPLCDDVSGSSEGGGEEALCLQPPWAEPRAATQDDGTRGSSAGASPAAASLAGPRSRSSDAAVVGRIGGFPRRRGSGASQGTPSPRWRARGVSDEPFLRVRPAPVRRPWRWGGAARGAAHAPVYAPHLGVGTRLPDGFFAFGGGGGGSRASRAVITMGGSPSPPPSPPPPPAPGPPPSRPQSAEDGGSHALPRLPSFTEVAVRQGYRPLQPRGFQSHRSAAGAAAAAAPIVVAAAEEAGPAQPAVPPPASPDEGTLGGQEPLSRTRRGSVASATASAAASASASMTAFIRSSVATLAAALQTQQQQSQPPTPPQGVEPRQLLEPHSAPPLPGAGGGAAASDAWFEAANPMRAARGREASAPQAVGQAALSGALLLAPSTQPVARAVGAPAADATHPHGWHGTRPPASHAPPSATGGAGRSRGPLYAYRSHVPRPGGGGEGRGYLGGVGSGAAGGGGDGGGSGGGGAVAARAHGAPTAAAAAAPLAAGLARRPPAPVVLNPLLLQGRGGGTGRLGAAAPQQRRGGAAGHHSDVARQG